MKGQYKVKIDVYGVVFTVAIGRKAIIASTYKDYKTDIVPHIDRSLGFVTGWGWCNESPWLVGFTKIPTSNIIAHESHHLVNFIMDHIGLKYDFTNDEPTAYLHGYVVEKITEVVNKYVKRYGKKVD